MDYRKNFLNGLFILLTLGALTNCGSNNGSTTAAPSPYQYHSVGTLCYNSSNQPVATSYCALSTTTTGNTLINGVCYSPTQQLLPTIDCPTVGTSTTTAQQCLNGPYTYTNPQTGQQSQGMCSIGVNGLNNCSGYTLTNSSGQTVTCL